MRFNGRLAFMGGSALLLGFLCLSALADPARRRVTYGAPGSDVRIDSRVARKAGPPRAPTHASIVDNGGPLASQFLSQSSGPPPPSPGLMFAKTSWDQQHIHTGPWQVGRLPGANIVHFVWTHWNKIPTNIENSDRFVHYNSYTVSTGVFNQGFDGCGNFGDAVSRGGYTCLGIGSGNDAYRFDHMRPEEGLPYSSSAHWYPLPGTCLRIDNELPTTPLFGELVWPHGNVQRNAGGTDIVHVVSHGSSSDLRDRLAYWRYNGTIWEGPVALDSLNPTLGYIVTADPNSDRAAIALHTNREPQFGGLSNVAYYESATEGAGWISGAELGDGHKVFVTNYHNPLGPEAYQHIGATYDNSSRLHIVWDELRQAGVPDQMAIRHWNSQRGTIRPVVLDYCDRPFCPPDRKLSKVTIGIGDGATPCQGGAETNFDYVYVLYTRFGGETPAEQADHSALGYPNGELTLSISPSSGLTWTPPLNLTNTKTPGCNPGPGTPTNPDPPRPDSVCRSEHWASIGEMVHDIDIIFISDLDAGDITQGEGTWQMNPVHYLRIADSDTICPRVQANFAAFIEGRIDCEYHAAPGGSVTERLTIINLGNATMNGTISVTEFNGPPGWLTVTGAGPYSIPAGNPDLTPNVAMSAVGVPDGALLQGEIVVTHNDPSKPSPWVAPINFFVFSDFSCPEDEVLRTGVASPGSLALHIGSNGRFASQDDMGGLFRFGDSSSCVFDASLLVAYGPQGPDTVVFHRFFDRNDPGQFGFRPLSSLDVDTSAYRTGAGYARASTRMCTKDSVVGITVDWVYPQHPDSDEFVLAQWSFYPLDNDTITALAVGLLADYDVTPAAKWGQVQEGVDNRAGGDPYLNLVWQQGTDTAGHVADPYRTATRYRGGVAFLYDQPMYGVIVGPPFEDIQSGGGPTSGFLYRSLVDLAGWNLFTDSAVDLYTFVDLARGETVAPGDTIHVVAALLSDTLSADNLKSTAAKARSFAAANGFMTFLPSRCDCACHGDPRCDGMPDVLDVVHVVAEAFRGQPPMRDLTCPHFSRTDMDCNCLVDVLDIVRIVDRAFRGDQTPVCNSCQMRCL